LKVASAAGCTCRTSGASFVAEFVVQRDAEICTARSETKRLDGLHRELAVQAERALDRDLPLVEGGIGENLRLWRFLEREASSSFALLGVRRFIAALVFFDLAPIIRYPM
jgi:hypothetical protein